MCLCRRVATRHGDWVGRDVAIRLGELTSSADRRLDKEMGAKPLAQLFGS